MTSTQSFSASQPHCRVPAFLPVDTAERRARAHRLRAAHPVFGSQGSLSARHGPDVAETAIFPTADNVAVPVRGSAMANRKHGPRGPSHA